MKKVFKIYKKIEETNLLKLSSVFLGFVVGKNKDKQIKPFFKNSFVVARENEGILYWQEESFEKTITKLDSLLQKKPKYNLELLKKIGKKAKEIKKITAKILKSKLNKKSNSEMIKLLQQLYNVEMEWADMLAVPNILILGFKETLSPEKELILSKVKPGEFVSFVVDTENMMNQAMNLVIKEISRRTFYSVNQLNYALPIEIKDIINKKGLKRYELEERQKICLVQCNRNGKLKIIDGDEARKFIKKNAK